jgi:hypothetical protein
MCKLVKKVTDEYVKAKSEGKHVTAYVLEAINHFSVGNNLLDFDCSLWTNLTNLTKHAEKAPVQGPQGWTDAVNDVVNSTKAAVCKNECSQQWKALCGVTATLLGVLSKKTEKSTTSLQLTNGEIAEFHSLPTCLPTTSLQLANGKIAELLSLPACLSICLGVSYLLLNLMSLLLHVFCCQDS